jgi:branched-chain amino acid transport system substrate-binding protein
MANTPQSSWKCTGNPSNPHEELENYGETCILCSRHRDRGKQPPRDWKKPAAIVAGIALLGGVIFGLLQVLKPISVVEQTPTPSPSIVPTTPNSSPTGTASSNPPSIKALPEWFSSGDRVLFPGKGNKDRDLGVEAFKAGKYPEAVKFFENAAKGDRTEPELQIYLNNAKARQAGSPLILATVVPVEGREASAEEMLRGIADAQTKFNNSGGASSQLLEVLIVNDGNDKSRAASVAQQLANNPAVLGVIGHNSSSASGAALAEYEKANPPLAMVSPTSSSTSLKSSVFLRTVPSDEASGKQLAEYTKNKLGVNQVAIFYNPNDNYSKSLEQAFTTQFQQLGGQVKPPIDLSQSQLDETAQLKVLQGQVGAALLFPDTKTTSVAIRIATANSNLQGKKLLLLGGDALYSPDTLTAGGAAVEGLILPIAWFAGSQDYAKQAENRWGGRVNWRTATSFDASQAMLKALSGSNPTRATVLQNLRSTNLSPTETSGESVQFSSTGERMGKPVLVQITKGVSGRPKDSEYGFQLVKP